MRSKNDEEREENQGEEEKGRKGSDRREANAKAIITFTVRNQLELREARAWGRCSRPQTTWRYLWTPGKY